MVYRTPEAESLKCRRRLGPEALWHSACESTKQSWGNSTSACVLAKTLALWLSSAVFRNVRDDDAGPLASKCEPGRPTARGRRRRGRMPSADTMTLDGNCLRRSTLLRGGGRRRPRITRVPL
jgi:hypothetical protein